MSTVELSNFTQPYHYFWQRFESAYYSKRLVHAFLLRGLAANCLDALCRHMIAIMLCKQPKEPCMACKSCKLFIQNKHPDLYLIEPEKAQAAIKVEQIRQLHAYLYTSAQVAENKIVLIQPAEKMNHSAANSLLKLLEEPPQNVYFILIAESIITIPATILSRCQHWYFPDFNHDDNYFAEHTVYKSERSFSELFKQTEFLVDDLLNIKKEKASVIAIAEKWLAYELSNLVRLIYLITAQMIHNYFHKTNVQSALSFKLEELAKNVKPIDLFFLLDKLNQIIKNLSYSINVNQRLTLEDLLLGFL